MHIKQISQVGGAVMSALWGTGALIADTTGIFPKFPWQYHALIGFITFICFMVWILWDKQSQINNMRGNVRLEARMHGLEIPYSKKTPDIGTTLVVVDKGKGIELTIDLEIWSKENIHTENLILNIIGSRISSIFVPWWKVWEVVPRVLSDFPAFRPVVGLRLETGEYRKFISGTSKQPFRDTVTFRLQGDNSTKVQSWSNLFMMELVLVVGMPSITYRKYLDWKSVMTKSNEPV